MGLQNNNVINKEVITPFLLTKLILDRLEKQTKITKIPLKNNKQIK